jgi:molecular chaperone DnaK
VVDRGTQLPTRTEVRCQTVSDNQVYWEAQLTQGEDRDLRYVKIIGSGDIRFDNAKPVGYPLLMRVAYDVDGLIHAYVFDGNTNAPFGELHIKRESNLTPDELAAMKQRLSGLTLS